MPVPDELFDPPSVGVPLVPGLDELPPSVGMDEPPRPPEPDDEYPNAEPDPAGDDDPGDELEGEPIPGEAIPAAEPRPGVRPASG